MDEKLSERKPNWPESLIGFASMQRASLQIPTSQHFVSHADWHKLCGGKLCKAAA
jgi:hypothetical protein